MTAEKPKLKYARVFGCAAFVRTENPKSKVHARASPGIFLGCNDHGVYSVLLLHNKKVVNYVHVTFDEKYFPALEHAESSSSGESISSEESDMTFGDISSGESEDREEFHSLNGSEHEEELADSIDNPSEEPTIERSQRNRGPPQRYGFSERATKAITAPITTSDEPSGKEAMNASPVEKDLWMQAMREEISNLEEKGTWVYKGEMEKTIPKRVQMATGHQVLPTHFVLKIKRDENGKQELSQAAIIKSTGLISMKSTHLSLNLIT